MAEYCAQEMRGDIPRIPGKDGTDGIGAGIVRSHAQTIANRPKLAAAALGSVVSDFR